MKKQIRAGVFETNSSSTHTLSIMPRKDYERWKSEGLYYCDGKLYTKEEVIKNLQEFDKTWGYEPKDYSDDDEFYDVRRDCDYETYEEWSEDEYLEIYVVDYTTESGDEIVAFGKYGYN